MLLIMSSLGYLLVCDLSIKAQTVACPWRNPLHAWLTAVRSPSRYTANHQASAHRGSSNPWKGHLDGWRESECPGFRSWWLQVRGKREKIGNDYRKIITLTITHSYHTLEPTINVIVSRTSLTQSMGLLGHKVVIFASSYKGKLPFYPAVS